MKKLSSKHRKNISIGLQHSLKFSAYHKRRDINGNKNPNWKNEITWHCPICNKELKLKPYAFKSKKTCSKKCGYILVSRKALGRKNPGVSEYMKRNNPMKNPETARKQSKTLMKKYASGDLNELKTKLSIAMRITNITYVKKKSTCKLISERMKRNNPMKNPETARKQSKTMKRNYAIGKLKPPSIDNGDHFHTGYYKDRKGNRHHYDSGWELKRMEFLDRNTEITWERADSKYRIPYIDGGGNSHTYFPDFIVNCKNKIVVEEIGKWTKSKKYKIEAALKFFKNKPEKFTALGKEQLNVKTWRTYIH